MLDLMRQAKLVLRAVGHDLTVARKVTATSPLSRSVSLRFLHLLLQRAEHLSDLLVDDRLQHALAHRAPPGRAGARRPPTSCGCPVRASLRLNEVSMFRTAPTPLPFACSLANSGSRSSVFSKSIDMRSPPRPSGIFTCARQCLSSWMSNDSTPGIVFAICAGSFRTCHTVSRGAWNCPCSPLTFIGSPR